MHPDSSTSPEQWRAVPDFPGYEVSDLGRVRSWHGPFDRHHRIHMRRSSPLILKPSPRIRGRLYVSLKSGCRTYQSTISHLMLLAFVGPCPEGMEGCHNDGNHLNNRLDNLRWDTKKANWADSRRHGTKRDGDNAPFRKLTSHQVATIRRRMNEGACSESLAVEYGVNPTTILAIVKGKSWRTAGGPILGWTRHKSGAPGERNANARFTQETARLVRQRYASGETGTVLAAEYHVTVPAIMAICHGRTWPNAGGPIVPSGWRHT